MHMQRFSKIRLALAALVVAATGACMTVQAAPLAPGVTLPATGELDPTGGVVQAGTGVAVPFASTPGIGSFSGTLTTTVISGDPSNLLGGLTFTYRITNDGSSQAALERMTNVDFTGYITDVSYQSPAAGVTPTAIDRQALGDTIGWLFSPLGGGRINPGLASAVLVVQTNAPNFAPINANIIDGSTASVASFGPVPEPTCLALVGSITLAALRPRRRSLHEALHD
jgi:hypothetical protein